MGGAATKEFGTERISKEDFEKLLKVLKKIFLKQDLKNDNWNEDSWVLVDENFAGSSYKIKKDFKINYLPYFENKQDFGDCDLLSTLSHKEFEKILEENKDLIKIIGVKKNGDVNSYAIQFKLDNRWSKPFQLDHIRESLYNYNFAYNYYSYNDLGNFIGRIAAAMNMKFGHDGLYLNYYFKEDGKRVGC